MLRKIERYEVLDELGHGGMATVYRARDSKLDRLIALKVMHPHLRGAKEARDRFRREAQSVARLGHPRILEIYDYSGEDSEESYIASQLLTGPTLKKWAEDHAPLPAEIAACIGIEIAEALAAAHDKGIVHRDVKPENILLHENRELKLTDFGIADMVDSHSVTATGQILGSPGHMAPEQIEGGDTDARTDLFALGTVLFYLSTGRLPFVGKNPHQILKRIVDGEHPDPLRLEPRMGGRMRAILNKLLAKKPEERHDSARALIEELQAFVLLVGIEDPAAEVARFLASPDTETKAITARIVERYTALGKRAQESGDIPTAQDAYARVLSLDDGNQEVLALLQTIGRTSTAPEREAEPKKTSPLPPIAVGIGALVAVAIGIRALSGGTDAGLDAGVLVPVLDGGAADAGSDAPDAPSDAPSPDGGALEDARVRITDTITHVAPIPVPRPPRPVTFAIEPSNVMVSIDGAASVSYLALGAGVMMTPGRHRVTIHPNVGCCEDASFDVEVPAGEGAYAVRRRLEARPALLIVRTPPGVSGLVVVVEGGRARGGSGVLDVPIESSTYRETLSVRASAPGYQPLEQELDFEAGEETTWRPTLTPLEAVEGSGAGE